MSSLSGFGENYELLIGKTLAKRLLPEGESLPRMGCEVIITIVSDRQYSGFKHQLLLQNISGSLCIVSNNVNKKSWQDIFNFDIDTKQFNK